MTRAARYLDIPTEASRELGLCWSADREAIERSGRTFALAGEVQRFLEGFASERPLIHFGFLLHFLHLLRSEDIRPEPPPALRELARAYRAAGRPGRTAGVFCAVLCRQMPPVPEPPSSTELARELASPYLILTASPGSDLTPETLPFSLHAFEVYLARAVAGYSFEELVHWFQHGVPPVDGLGQHLAEELLAEKPRSLHAVLADLTQDHRLAGAAPFVSQLVSALTLPPRRLADHDLPLGGYADVSSRGQPEQILPGQFALDEMEFVRRFAEHELLYYRREEPHTRTREQLVVLLDQGVRTWGTVRLVLSAAVLALGQLALRRRLPLQVAFSSSRGGLSSLIDPRTIDPNELAELLAASDLAVHPALALERVLEESSSLPRDVVLLTHPRSLAEADVAAAARRVRPETRLFALSVDGHGKAELSELRKGLPVPLTRFQIDLTASSPVHPRAEAVEVGFGRWQGDVEPVPYPFCFGGLAQSAASLLFAFDHAGDWLLAVSSRGQAHLLETDGSHQEMLPRVCVDGRLLTGIQAVLGVAGGFVVCGALSDRLVAAHYDLRSRTLRAHTFPTNTPFWPAPLWRYLRRLHTVVAVRSWAPPIATTETYSVHLSTGSRELPAHVNIPLPPPAVRGAAPLVAGAVGSSAPSQGVRCPLPYQDAGDPPGPGGSWRQPELLFDPETGSLALEDVIPAWPTFTPLEDGRPALKGCALVRAECQRETLAATFRLPGEQKLRLFAFGSEGRVLFHQRRPENRDRFTLSPDGTLLALQRGPGQVEIREVRSPDTPRCASLSGRFHHDVAVLLGDRWLSLRIGGKESAADGTVHLACWQRGKLECFIGQGDPRAFVAQHLPGGEAHALPALRDRVPGFLNYDRERFQAAAWSNLLAVVDCFGEVFLFEHTGNLVAGFFAFRQQLAAWLPDGTCAGPQLLLGRRPENPSGAASRIGAALLAAWQRGEGTIT